MTAKTRFRGSFTALVTPFKNGSVDERAFRELVDWQIAEGTNGLVPVGTTGESPTLSHQEHEQVVEWCIDQAKGRVPVVAGAGSNSTAEAISLAKHAEKAGADAVLVVSPYYNKPTQEGLYQHFKAINDKRGHATGDIVLSSLGKLLTRVARRTDIIGRWGGEEFVVALVETDLDGAKIAGERFRVAVEKLEVVDPKNERVPVTASFGIAGWTARDRSQFAALFGRFADGITK